MASVMQTPPRPAPGLFPQTPAPRSNPAPAPSFGSSTRAVALTRGSSTTNVSTRRPTEPPVPAPANSRPAESLKPAERAARAVNEALLNETRYPELDTFLSQGYSIDYEVHSSTTWAPFQKVRMHNIPDQIFEQYNRAQVSTSMGLFAELRHAWVTIDNALYMWDYSISDPELLGFEAQPHSITAVKLAVPRAGVFLPSIKHMIVLATTSDVHLLGLGTDPNPGGSAGLALFQTGMSVSVRGLDVTVIGNSPKSGRVFFGGRTENELYELMYQAQDSWFSSRCSRICHTSSKVQALGTALNYFGSSDVEFVEQIAVDDSRDLLYTLSSKSTIRVFQIQPDGRSLERRIVKEAKDIYSNIAHIINPSEALNQRIKIVAISTISKEEASRYVLVATTATGYRIYLSATSSGYWSSSSSYAPHSMQALHVRTPPIIPNAQGELPPSPHHAILSLTTTRLAQRFPPGFFFCFHSPDRNSPVDNLFISAPDAARLARPPEAGQPAKATEPACWISLNSRAEDIGIVTPYSPPIDSPTGFGNDLAVQFDKPVPEVAVLTNTGVHVLRRRRLVDVFATLIRQGGGSDGLQAQVNNLIRSYGRTEILATALAVACGQGFEVAQDRSVRINDPEILEVARKIFIDYGGKPSINQNSISDKAVVPIEAVRPSPRHDAVARYLSRLLRSMWKSLVAMQAMTPAGYMILPAVPIEKLRSVQEDLTALKRFFDVNKSFIRGLSGPDDLAKATSKDDELALQGEHRALHSLVKFVSDTIEGISFVLVLFEERVAEIVPLLPENSRPAFLRLTFEGLFSTPTGLGLAKELVKAIVNRNIAKGSNVETVAEALRRKCGSFCSADDVIIFKAQEQLKRAAEAGNNAEFARNLLNESLRLFEQVAYSLPKDYLESAVQQYVKLSFFAGAVQLVLKVAYEADKTNDALSWLTDGEPDQDSRREKFHQRNEFYNLIHGVLLAIDDSLQSTPSFVDGRPTMARTRRDEAYEVISQSSDEVFLTNLYDWYLSQGWFDRLLTTESSFIVTYLQRKSEDDPAYADLLWKYYGQNNQFHEAGRVQLKLARSQFKLPLDKRIEYLSRARANASAFIAGSTTNRKQKQKLLHEITELLDIANIQDEILQRLKDDPRLPDERRTEILGQVDGPILTVNELFNSFADNAGYYDICLMIYHVADHRDASQIKQTWQQFLQTVHDRAESTDTDTNEAGREDGRGAPSAAPWEVVAEEVRELGGKLKSSETVFPIPTLVDVLEKYSFSTQRGVAPSHWVVDVFLDLEVAHEVLFDTLETIYFTQENPFAGAAGRRAIVSDLLYVIERWLQTSARAGVGQVAFGSEQGVQRVEEVLNYLVSSGAAGGCAEDETRSARSLIQRMSQMLS